MCYFCFDSNRLNQKQITESQNSNNNNDNVKNPTKIVTEQIVRLDTNFINNLLFQFNWHKTHGMTGSFSFYIKERVHFSPVISILTESDQWNMTNRWSKFIFFFEYKNVEYTDTHLPLLLSHFFVWNLMRLRKNDVWTDVEKCIWANLIELFISKCHSTFLPSPW